jgi:hypothetical protein
MGQRKWKGDRFSEEEKRGAGHVLPFPVIIATLMFFNNRPNEINPVSR